MRCWPAAPVRGALHGDDLGCGTLDITVWNLERLGCLQMESKALTGGPEAVEAALGQLVTLMEQQGPTTRLLLLVAHTLLRMGRCGLALRRALGFGPLILLQNPKL